MTALQTMFDRAVPLLWVLASSSDIGANKCPDALTGQRANIRTGLLSAYSSSSTNAAMQPSQGQHMHTLQHHPHKPHVTHKDVNINGWHVITRKGPIISDRDVEAFSNAIGTDVKSLPEMLFSSSRVTLHHKPSGFAIDLTALAGLQGWHQEALPPLQVKVAQAWRAAREHEIAAQNAVQLEYDWTFTSPYSGHVVSADAVHTCIGPGDIGKYGPPHTSATHPSSGAGCPTDTCSVTVAPWLKAAAPPVTSCMPASDSTATTVGEQRGTAQSAVDGANGSEKISQGQSASVQLPEWQETTEQMDRGLLMERDPILFFDEVALYESDLDDNGVSQLTVKLRVMPRCWLVLVRFWLRVDGSMVRLRETRLFCRHDSPATARKILRETRWCEGAFSDLRASGAPGEGPSYADGDAAAQVFQAVAPTGLKLIKYEKLELPESHLQ